MARDRLRVVLVGWGAIGGATADLLTNADIDIVGIAVRDRNSLRRPAPRGAVVLTDPAELARIAPDVVAEAAGRESVLPWGRAALACGADFVVSSVSAFADPAVLNELRDRAVGRGVRLQIQPGALAGVDGLASAQALGLDHVTHRMIKPPNAWVGSPAEGLCDLGGLTEATEFFRASAAETARQFPKNANVAMTTALAGIGPDATEIVLVADPGAMTNRHEIRAAGAFGDLDVAIANHPLPGNPRSSAMAALNLARALRHRTSALVI